MNIIYEILRNITKYYEIEYYKQGKNSCE